MSESYGHAYLTSYGWTGTGTGLRKGAVDKPLAIPPKKNLSGLGKDRDDAFPFWDHLFTAASKAIKIRVSSDEEDVDDTEDPSSHTSPDSAPFQRTTTGIFSNRRPIHGTPASTPGSITPNLGIDAGVLTPGPSLSLVATAKREAAKRGLYSRFFKGPVLGPGDKSHLSSPVSTAVPAHIDDQDNVFGERNKSEKRKSEDRAETREERKERKRLKKDRQAARAAKRAKTALVRGKAKGMKDRPDVNDQLAREHQNKERV